VEDLRDLAAALGEALGQGGRGFLLEAREFVLAVFLAAMRIAFLTALESRAARPRP
jgi:hypothetical protein